MFRSIPVISFLLSLVLGAAALAQVAPSSRTPEIPPAQRIHARNGVVVAQESRASRIGVEILDVTGKVGEMKSITITVTWKGIDGITHTRSSTGYYCKDGLYDYYYTLA